MLCEKSQITTFPCKCVQFTHNASIKFFELQKSNYILCHSLIKKDIKFSRNIQNFDSLGEHATQQFITSIL